MGKTMLNDIKKRREKQRFRREFVGKRTTEKNTIRRPDGGGKKARQCLAHRRVEAD